jgi:hypothetical protein
MDIIGPNPDLPALPGAGGDAKLLQCQGRQAAGHLFA